MGLQPEVQQCPGLYQKRKSTEDQQGEGSNSPLPLCSHKTPSGVFMSRSGTPSIRSGTVETDPEEGNKDGQRAAATHS